MHLQKKVCAMNCNPMFLSLSKRLKKIWIDKMKDNMKQFTKHMHARRITHSSHSCVSQQFLMMFEWFRSGGLQQGTAQNNMILFPIFGNKYLGNTNFTEFYEPSWDTTGGPLERLKCLELRLKRHRRTLRQAGSWRSAGLPSFQWRKWKFKQPI